MVLHTQSNIPLLSTAYLPPVSYFVYLARYETVVIEQFETYAKQSYRNRCMVYSEKGVMPLSIPVSKPSGNHTKTHEIKLFNNENWQRNHWRAIETAYVSSPFFLYYKDELEPFFIKSYDRLLDYNSRLMETLARLIGLNTVFKLTTDFTRDPTNLIDLRSAIHPKKESLFPDFPSYIQVFSDRHGFIPDLSIIDLLFNLGPDTRAYLEDLVLPEY